MVAVVAWGEIGLEAVRLFGLLTALWGLSVMVGMLRRSASHKSVTIIPPAIVVFEAFWLSVLAGFLLFLLVLDRGALSTGWGFFTYGSSLVWSIFGAIWIIHVGSRNAADAAGVYQRLEAEGYVDAELSEGQ